MPIFLLHLFSPKGKIYRNLSKDRLVMKILARKEGKLARTGAVVVYTGQYTGRSPNDRFIVDTKRIHKHVNWGKINVAISKEKYDRLYNKITKYLSTLAEIFVTDCFVCADPKYRLPVRVISEPAYSALLATHLFIKPSKKELADFSPKLTIFAAPSCLADPLQDGTHSSAFIVLNLEKKIVLIGGSKYCGEIKKSVFSFLNYFLPQKNVFPMHCSANVGINGSSALFFGLSGTGKTTLSADTGRKLVGDDEHGWFKNGIFNFEGGCYAKCINLKKESEPQIFSAIRDGAVVENVVLKDNGELDFTDSTITENTRVAYPLTYIKNSIPSGVAGHPKVLVFLTADALGVMPSVARLDQYAALYYFLSGYTSKMAGTERGIVEPKAVFSQCFGAPFMPSFPHVYANLLKEYITKYKSSVYLVNTGWIGGPYGVGKRISIKDTRMIVTEILKGSLEKVEYRHDDIFNLDIPLAVAGVDPKILNPKYLWRNKEEYDKKAKKLARLFVENFNKFKYISQEVIAAGPKG